MCWQWPFNTPCWCHDNPPNTGASAPNRRSVGLTDAAVGVVSWQLARVTPGHESSTSSAPVLFDATLISYGSVVTDMRNLSMDNGRVVPAPDIRVDCADCDGRQPARRKDGKVYCGRCGKRHSNASLVDVNTPLEGEP